MGCSAGRVVQQNGNDQSVRPIPFNVLLKGDSGVGKVFFCFSFSFETFFFPKNLSIYFFSSFFKIKTGIFSQCTKNQFSETFQSTIGVDFATKTLTFGDSSYLFKIVWNFSFFCFSSFFSILFFSFFFPFFSCRTIQQDRIDFE